LLDDRGLGFALGYLPNRYCAQPSNPIGHSKVTWVPLCSAKSLGVLQGMGKHDRDPFNP